MVHGTGAPPPGGGTVATHMDHRIAMSALVLGHGARAAGRGGRCRLHRHQLPRLRRADERLRRRRSRDAAGMTAPGHRHRWPGRGRQGHPGAPAGRRHLACPTSTPACSIAPSAAGCWTPAAIRPMRRGRAAARALLPADLDRGDLRGPEADAAAAAVAAIPAVRAALLDFQRDFGRRHGAVLDGRDIGTVVFPDAPVKLFVTASPASARRRRWLELRAQGHRRRPGGGRGRDARPRRAGQPPRRRPAAAGRGCRRCWTPRAGCRGRLRRRHGGRSRQRLRRSRCPLQLADREPRRESLKARP